ncbi:MAG TPA: hypothetical protein VH207_02850 [Chthoniobacterales bacterium]|jgi:hypothetical protein|nr:hypothetical protein [Chthoniobacterales bacterium]
MRFCPWREAHSRRGYQNVTPKLDKEQLVADGELVEEAVQHEIPYRRWSAGFVLEEMHKAGWRLADLLQKILVPPSPRSAL